MLVRALRFQSQTVIAKAKADLNLNANLVLDRERTAVAIVFNHVKTANIISKALETLNISVRRKCQQQKRATLNVAEAARATHVPESIRS